MEPTPIPAELRQAFYREVEEEQQAQHGPDLMEFLDKQLVLDEAAAQSASSYSRFSPERIRREVAAKRDMLEQHRGGHRCDWGEYRNSAQGIPCAPALRVAQAYAGEPDYLEDWTELP